MAIGIKENGRNVKELLPPVRPAKSGEALCEAWGQVISLFPCAGKQINMFKKKSAVEPYK